MADKPQTVYIVGCGRAKHHRAVAKGSGAVWSPDGKSIAYLAEGQPQGVQIFVLHLTVPGPATQILPGAGGACESALVSPMTSIGTILLP